MNEFTENAIEYSRHSKKDNQLALSRHPIVVSEGEYFLIKRNKESFSTAIFILNTNKKQLYLLEEL